MNDGVATKMLNLLEMQLNLISRFFKVSGWRHEESAATLSSIVVHLALILFLALIVFEDPVVGTKSQSFFSSPVSSESNFELTAYESTSTPTEPTDGGSNLEIPIAEIPVDFEAGPIHLDAIEVSTQIRLPENVVAERTSNSEISFTSTTLANSLEKSRSNKKTSKSISGLMPTLSEKGTSVVEPLLTHPNEGVIVENSAQGAASKILSQLDRIGEGDDNGPVQIIWLMDASLSLLNERKKLAPVVHSFYEKLASKHKEKNLKLTSDIYAFGQALVSVAHDTGDPSPKVIASAIEKLPIDESGVENVLAALSKALTQVPSYVRKRIEVVVWTDESGDDLNLLEDVIQQCRYRQARVHVVGPLSVFGMRQGLQQYIIGPPYNIPMMLPVNRGPDSAFVERARLPIWDSTANFAWRSRNFMPAALNGANFGGPHRERLLAPTGPYALTRLALATGGTFTALERPGDDAAFDSLRIKEYLPDYRSGSEIAMDIDKYPLRKAVIQSAALMGDMEYWPPRFEFPSAGAKEFPYPHFVPYMEPARALSTLENDLANDIANLQPVQQAIEQAIQMLLMAGMSDSYGSQGYVNPSDKNTTIEVGGLRTAAAYDAEDSARWRAWYDLNLGRLLAHSVRINEYVTIRQRFMLPNVQQEILSNGVNHFILIASKQLYGGTDSDVRSEFAHKLLERVQKDHPNSPWSQLAQWELDRPFGMDCKYSFIAPPPPPQPRIFATGPSVPMPASSGMRSFPPPTIPRL